MELVSLYLFVFLGLFSPGPNVILLTASGARFGFARTIPHILGVVLGVGVIAALAGLGLGVVVWEYPVLRVALSFMAAGWIAYLAWRMWHTTAPQNASSARPFTFLQAVLFQWINPKLWGVAMTAIAFVPVPYAPVQAAMAMGAAFAGVNLFVCAFWAMFGQALSAILNSPRGFQAFMRIMAVILLFSASMIFI